MAQQSEQSSSKWGHVNAQTAFNWPTCRRYSMVNRVLISDEAETTFFYHFLMWIYFFPWLSEFLRAKCRCNFSTTFYQIWRIVWTGWCQLCFFFSSPTLLILQFYGSIVVAYLRQRNNLWRTDFSVGHVWIFVRKLTQLNKRWHLNKVLVQISASSIYIGNIWQSG